MLWLPARRLAGDAVHRLLGPAALLALRQSSLLTGDGAHHGISAAAGQAAGVAGERTWAAQSGISRSETTLAHDATPAQPHSSKPASRREAQWLAKVEEVKQYAAQHGRLPLQESGPLGVWVKKQRMAYKVLQQGDPSPMTPERSAALGAVPGWVWDAHASQWQEQLERLRQHVAQHGRLPLLNSGLSLACWVSVQRRDYKALQQGEPSPMTAGRIAALEAVAGWVWDGHEAQWQEQLERLRQHQAQHGRLPLLKSGSLGMWVDNQRKDYKALQQGKPSWMTVKRIAALEAVLGWVWDAREARWQEMYQQVLQEVVQGGRLRTERDGHTGSWVLGQRSAYTAFKQGRAGRRMTAERAAALEALPGWKVL